MAIETAGSFSSATVNGYTVKTTGTTSALSSASNSLISQSIIPSTDGIENKKIIMGMETKGGFNDTAAVLV